MEATLDRQEKYPLGTLNVEQAKRFHYLYDRVSADLAKIATFSAERETRQYLERLVARAYGESTRRERNRTGSSLCAGC